jgi:hypothetical protein
MSDFATVCKAIEVDNQRWKDGWTDRLNKHVTSEVSKKDVLIF